FIMFVVYFPIVFTAVRVTRVTEDTLTLAGVAPGFVVALLDHRQAKKPEAPPASPWRLPKAPPSQTTRHFTDTASEVFDLARREGQQWKDDHLGTAHLLYGLSAAGGGVATHILNHFGITPERIRHQTGLLGLGDSSSTGEGGIPWTPAVKRVVALANAEAD